jgi:hypothetical protein
MKPENRNFLQPTKFILTFPEVPDMVYFCQKANLPGVSLGQAVQSTPNLDLYHSGTKLEYGTFDVSFLVNENLTAWTTLYDWMKDLSSVESTYTKRKANRKQAVLTIMSNQNNPKLRIKYLNIFPISVGDLEFDTTLSAEEHVIATASFRYDLFEIEPLS